MIRKITRKVMKEIEEELAGELEQDPELRMMRIEAASMGLVVGAAIRLNDVNQQVEYKPGDLFDAQDQLNLSVAFYRLVRRLRRQLYGGKTSWVDLE